MFWTHLNGLSIFCEIHYLMMINNSKKTQLLTEQGSYSVCYWKVQVLKGM